MLLAPCSGISNTQAELRFPLVAAVPTSKIEMDSFPHAAMSDDLAREKPL